MPDHTQRGISVRRVGGTLQHGGAPLNPASPGGLDGVGPVAQLASSRLRKHSRATGPSYLHPKSSSVMASASSMGMA
jgi:hypothetical protein